MPVASTSEAEGHSYLDQRRQQKGAPDARPFWGTRGSIKTRRKHRPFMEIPRASSSSPRAERSVLDCGTGSLKQDLRAATKHCGNAPRPIFDQPAYGKP